MRASQTHSFTADDGVLLFYRHWPASTGSTAQHRTLVMFHRGHEHSGRMAHLAEELDLPDSDVLALQRLADAEDRMMLSTPSAHTVQGRDPSTADGLRGPRKHR